MAFIDDFRLAPQSYDEAVPVDQLSEHPANPNLGDVGAISESMARHGFYGACLVQKSTGRILAGNHRFRVAKDQGATTLPVFWLDCDDDEALRILSVDNRTTHLATFDEERLIALLKNVADTPKGLTGTGFDEAALATLVRHQAAITATPDQDDWSAMPDFDQPDGSPAYSVTVHFPTNEDAERFFELLGAERPKARFFWWPHHDGFKGLDFHEMEVTE